MTQTQRSDDIKKTTCSFKRRLVVIFYDSILLFCVWLVMFFFMPLIDDWFPKPIFQVLKLAYLFAISFLFFSWFWKHGGQTPGMRAWNVKLVSMANHIQNMTWHRCWLRFMYSTISWGCAGIGFLWAIFDKNKYTWHDLLSKTEIIVLPKKSQ